MSFKSLSIIAVITSWLSLITNILLGFTSILVLLPHLLVAIVFLFLYIKKNFSLRFVVITIIAILPIYFFGTITNTSIYSQFASTMTKNMEPIAYYYFGSNLYLLVWSIYLSFLFFIDKATRYET